MLTRWIQLVPPCRRARACGRRSFTLIEVICTMTVLAAIGSAASLTILTALDGYLDAATQAQLHAELSVTLDRLDRELRKVELKTGGAIAPNIASVTSTSMAWNDDYSLTLSGSQLMFAENGGPATVLVKDVSSFTVQTFNESNTALGSSLSGSACDPIRRVSLTISLQRAGMIETLRSRTYLRCTMEGAG